MLYQPNFFSKDLDPIPALRYDLPPVKPIQRLRILGPCFKPALRSINIEHYEK